MHTLRYWSFARILLISAGWVVLCLVLAAAWLAFVAVAQRRIGQLTAGPDRAASGEVPLVVQLILVYEVLGAFLVLRSR